jgi:hypothetical protein
VTSKISISILHMDLDPPRHDPEGISLEVDNGGLRMWDLDCNICGEPYSFDFQRPAEFSWRGYTVAQMPHLDEIFRAIVEHQVANRGNLVGAHLQPAALALEGAIAARDGSSVYFAQAGDRVKIGWSKRVAARLAQLQTGNAAPIRLLGTMPGARTVERRVHAQFAELRLAGEWFQAAPELLAYVARESS